MQLYCFVITPLTKKKKKKKKNKKGRYCPQSDIFKKRFYYGFIKNLEKLNEFSNLSRKIWQSGTVFIRN